MSDHPWLEIETLVILFKYKNRNSLYNAIYKGSFPVPTFRVGKRLYADKEVVKQYFRKKREESMRALTDLGQGDRESAADSGE